MASPATRRPVRNGQARGGRELAGQRYNLTYLLGAKLAGRSAAGLARQGVGDNAQQGLVINLRFQLRQLGPHGNPTLPPDAGRLHMQAKLVSNVLIALTLNRAQDNLGPGHFMLAAVSATYDLLQKQPLALGYVHLYWFGSSHLSPLVQLKWLE